MLGIRAFYKNQTNDFIKQQYANGLMNDEFWAYARKEKINFDNVRINSGRGAGGRVGAVADILDASADESGLNRTERRIKAKIRREEQKKFQRKQAAYETNDGSSDTITDPVTSDSAP